MNEMTRITISKIIAGIVVMLIALNYIGNNGITYTTSIAITDKVGILQHYYDSVLTTSSNTNTNTNIEIMTHDMSKLVLLSNSIIHDTPSCYYFSILNKTAYILSNYTKLEYTVLIDNYVESVVRNNRVRTSTDLTVITFPTDGVLYLNNTFIYGMSDSTYTPISTDDDTVVFSSTSIYTTHPPVVFIIKLNLYQDTISSCAGSVQVSLFMIGLILFWYVHAYFVMCLYIYLLSLL